MRFDTELFGKHLKIKLKKKLDTASLILDS